ncbi:histidine kinase [uncultured Bacteroides sp.]|uniref:sensor histidine kinase n=1 Tax=uncultured Bacteroides sp. TaxID=162156 RepID=UPI00280B1201|nr:histidine kinase [uncultured Bacteroides sp.]
MNSFVIYISRRLLLIGLIGAAFIIYPNIICLPWEIHYPVVQENKAVFCLFFIFRLLYFGGLFILLLRFNLRKATIYQLKHRFYSNFAISAVAYAIFVPISLSFASRGVHDAIGSVLIFQFFVICCVCTLLGHIIMLYITQQEKEMEIERLRTENLQSRCDALTNQINPHFFFNSLNGISSLIRKKDDKKTLEYVDQLSDMFRYILQSDRKGVVSLREELKFIEAFQFVIEVRFANKLVFSLNIDEPAKDALTLPVLSLLPLVDNVIVHNRIDADHKMEISIYLNERNELVVSNPIYPKLSVPQTNGTGLKNLENRFLLLTNRKIRIETTEKRFTVYLPLK